MWFYISSHSVTKCKEHVKHGSNSSYKTLAEDEVVGGLKGFASSSGCYSKNITKHMKAKEIIPSNGHQVLESKFRSLVFFSSLHFVVFTNTTSRFSVSCIFFTGRRLKDSKIDLLSGIFSSHLVLINCVELK